MSFILDALKKSEQDRKKGTVPGLGTVQGLPSNRFADNWPGHYYLPAALLLLAILAGLTWYVLREPPPHQAETVTPNPATQTAAPTGSPYPKPFSADKPISTGAKSVSHPDKVKHSPATASPPQSPPAPALPAATPIVPAPTGGVTTPVDRPPIKSVPQTVAAAPEVIRPLPMSQPPSPPQEQVVTMATSKPPAASTPTEEAEVVIKPEEMPIIPFAELPSELKKEIPEVKIGIHFFSDDPFSRRAGINGRLLREGEQVGKDLTLKEITRDGAIIAYKGRRFSLPVFPR